VCVLPAIVAVTGAEARAPDVPAPPVALPDAEAFVTRRTDHFLIWYDTSYEVLRPLINRLEGTYGAVTRIGRYYGFPMADPVEPLNIVIVVVGSHEDYAVLARRAEVSAEGTAGFYDPRDNVSIFGDILTSPSLRPINQQIEHLEKRIARARGIGKNNAAKAARIAALGQDLSRLQLQRDAIVERFNRVVIQHEAAHQIFFNLGVLGRNSDCPTWLVEGLATQFEVPQSSAQKGLHHTNQMRLRDLRAAAGIDAAEKTVSDAVYDSAFGRGRLMPLAELIGDEGVFGGSGDEVATAYAQSWALVFYLARTKPDAFSGYLADVAARAREQIGPEEELRRFVRFFGALDEGFERDWLAYMVRLRFDPTGN